MIEVLNKKIQYLSKEEAVQRVLKIARICTGKDRDTFTPERDEALFNRLLTEDCGEFPAKPFDFVSFKSRYDNQNYTFREFRMLKNKDIEFEEKRNFFAYPTVILRNISKFVFAQIRTHQFYGQMHMIGSSKRFGAVGKDYGPLEDWLSLEEAQELTNNASDDYACLVKKLSTEDLTDFLATKTKRSEIYNRGLAEWESTTLAITGTEDAWKHIFNSRKIQFGAQLETVRVIEQIQALLEDA